MPMTLRFAIASALGFLTAAFASGRFTADFEGGDPIALSEPLVIRDVSIDLTSRAREHYLLHAYPDVIGGRDTTEALLTNDERARDLVQDLVLEVREELHACDARKGRLADVVVQVGEIDYGGPLNPVDKRDRLSAVAEFHAADGSGVIARYPIEVVSPVLPGVELTSTDGGSDVSVNDREGAMGEWLGRSLCASALKSDARPAGWRNLTR